MEPYKERNVNIRLVQYVSRMNILDGYKSFFDAADDPNLVASKKKDGMFFIFRSIEAWKEEKCPEEDIPAQELILSEFKKNRFLAHP
jgi:hypothetical protein